VELSVLNRIVSRALAGALLLLCFAPLVHAVDRSKSLPPRYRHWLNEEVSYIIDSDERKQFLSLQTDAERDYFINEFWERLNPTPGAQDNPYKDEHYQRLAYANEHFGSTELEDGWRTDMGRIYILIGAPKQIVAYPAARNVRPMEIWFYESPSRVLPPYFNLIFYKPSAGEQYTLYSPFQDGPARLVATLEAMNDQKRSLDILRKSLGDEVAKTALSLLPDQSVNLDDYTPDLTSDTLIHQIESLPFNPLTRELREANQANERITTSILTGDTAPDMSYAIFRDAQGAATVSCLVKNQMPDSSLIGAGSDHTLEYNVELRTNVLTAGGQPVYQQDDEITGKVGDKEAAVARLKRFGAETRLPLAPGKYVLVATLTNNLNRVATRQHVSVTVPEPKPGMIGISPLLAYGAPAATPDPGGSLPFSASKVRFTPRGAQTVTLLQGEKLPLVFQLWLDPKATAPESSGGKIHLRYVFGSVTASHDSATTENEEIDSVNHDAAGNLVTGHTVDTSQLDPGTYRLVVGANWDGAAQTAYEALTLRVQPATQQVDAWTAYAGVPADVKALDDLKRGMSAEAEGEDDAAQVFYLRSLGEGPGELRTLDKLAALLDRHGATDALAGLSQQPVVMDVAVAPKTLLLIAGAMTKNGNPKGVVKMLDAQIKLQPPSAELYSALAGACEATGDSARARDLRALAAGK
jgi:GWxTD domain-containing protein